MRGGWVNITTLGGSELWRAHPLPKRGQPAEGRPDCRLRGPEFITHRILSLLTGHDPKPRDGVSPV